MIAMKVETVNQKALIFSSPNTNKKLPSASKSSLIGLWIVLTITEMNNACDNSLECSTRPEKGSALLDLDD